MKRAILPLILLATTAQAGRIATDIRRSRELPEMEAMAAWTMPRLETALVASPVAPVTGAVLYGETVRVRQLAGTLTEPLSIGGKHPTIVAAGTTFAAWWVGNERLACTMNGADPAKPDKLINQVCLGVAGGKGFDRAIVRPIGDRIENASTAPLPAALTLSAPKPEATETVLWPGANLFSYRQSDGVGIIVNYNRALPVAAMEYGKRLVVRQVAGSTIALRTENTERDDLSRTLDSQKARAFKDQEIVADLSAGAATVEVGGGRFLLEREPDGRLRVTAQSPFATWWTMDESGRDFRWRGERIAFGAQAR